jgi:hypothetical protein
MARDSEVRTIMGCVSRQGQSSKALTLTEGEHHILIEAESLSERSYTPEDCRHLARCLYRLARRVEARQGAEAAQ